MFWGGCVVFWCSFWAGFWLSESLRGVFTPARNGRLQTSPVDGGGTATPSPSMGRAGVGAENTQKVSCNEPSQEGRGRKEWGIPRLPIRRANRHLEANGYP